MRFRSQGKPRGIIQSRDQRRLTLVIVGVGALVLLISVAGRPGFWQAITGRPESAPSASTERSISEDLLGVQNLQPDEFTTGTTRTTAEAPSLDLKALVDKDEAARLERLSQAEIRVLPDGGPEPVPADLLRPVRDDIIGVHSSEADAYFVTLRLSQKLTGANVPAAREGRYALFMDSPESCRGKAWKVRGTLRRLTRVQSDANSFGVKNLYDAWLSLPDSGNQLVHVVAASADAGLPLGDTNLKTAPEVVLTGYFFKREGYVRAGKNKNGDVALAPLLLTGRIQISAPTSSSTSVADELTPWLGWLTLLVCGGVAAVFWQFQISDSLFRRTRTHQLTTLPVRVSFDGVHAVTVGETLQQLERSAEQSDP